MIRLLLAVPLAIAQEPWSSALPILVIETETGSIPDEPKTIARMQVLDGDRNALGDAPTGYEGHIGIERRGSSPSRFPKTQYGVETRNEDGSHRTVSLLGLPAENDWVLYAPYTVSSPRRPHTGLRSSLFRRRIGPRLRLSPRRRG